MKLQRIFAAVAAAAFLALQIPVVHAEQSSVVENESYQESSEDTLQLNDSETVDADESDASIETEDSESDSDSEQILETEGTGSETAESVSAHADETVDESSENNSSVNAEVSLTETEEKEELNLTGNILNGGKAVSYHDITFYASEEDGTLYRTDNGNTSRITDYPVQYLNVTEDGKLFYTWMNSATGLTNIQVYDIESGNSATLYSVDILKGIKNLLVRDGRCYFISDRVIYALDIQSGSRQTLLNGRNDVSGFALDGNMLVYSAVTESGLPVMAYDLEQGTEVKAVADASGFDISDGYIYYANLEDNLYLYRVKYDGSNSQKLVSDQVSNIIADHEDIYYKGSDVSSSVSVYHVDEKTTDTGAAGECVEFSVLQDSEIVTASPEVVDLNEAELDEDALETDPVAGMATTTGEYKTWKQSDARWASRRFANGETMKQVGCLVTSLAICIVDAGIKDDTSFNPGIFFDLLYNNGGFTSSALLYWGVVSNVIDGFDLIEFGTYIGGKSDATITSEFKKRLESGQRVVVNVRGGAHWVAVDNITSNNISICDPGYDLDTLFNSSNRSIVYFTAYQTKSKKTTGTTTSSETLVKYKTTDTVNYRATASSSGTIKGSLAAGKTVYVVKGASVKADDYTWYKVKIGGSYYYIASKYLEKVIVATGVELNKTSVKLTRGSSVTLKATVSPDNAEDKTVTWSSGDTDIATVSSSGVVKALTSGTVTITAKTSNGKKATCTVTVPDVFSKYQTTSSLNYRTGPSTSSGVAGTFAKGTTLNIVKGYKKEANNYVWYKVKYNGNYYYVVKNYLKKLSTATDVTLNKTTASVKSSSTITLEATVTPSSATDGTITWSSSDTTTAKVSSAGVVTGIKPGTAVITAKTEGGLTAKCTVTVSGTPTLLKYVATDDLNYRTSPGTSASKAGMLKKGASVNVVKGFSKTKNGYKWYMIKIDSKYYYVVSSYLKKSSETVAVTAVTVNKDSCNVKTGNTVKLSATVAPTTATNQTTSWSSSNSKVATVTSAGVVKGVKVGTATITAKSNNGKTDNCKVTVTSETLLKYKTTDELNYRTTASTSGNLAGTLSKGKTVYVVKGGSKKANNYTWYKLKINGKYYYAVSNYLKRVTTTTAVTSVKLNKSSLSIKAGAKSTLTATIAPTNATNKTVTWSSSNKAVATVTSAGVVKGIKAGTATITAKSNNGKTASCKVTVTGVTLVKYKVTDDLNYRTKPSLSGAVVSYLPKGKTVYVVKGYKKTADGYTWYKLKISGKYYYAVKNYLKAYTS